MSGSVEVRGPQSSLSRCAPCAVRFKHDGSKTNPTQLLLTTTAPTPPLVVERRLYITSLRPAATTLGQAELVRSCFLTPS